MFGAIAVSLSVVLVVLNVVRDEVVERKPVVAGHEVDASLGPPRFATEDVGAGEETVREFCDCSVVALHKAAYVVTKLSVPFLPGVADKAADLIETRGVPGLGDQLRPGKHRVGLYVPDDRRVLHRSARFVTRED